MKSFLLLMVPLLALNSSRCSFAGDKDANVKNLPTGRAMWIWNTSNMVNNIVNNVGTAREELFEFCRSPHGNPDHRITVLFFGCKESLFGSQTNLRNFIAEAFSNGLTIEYLDGDPTWATYNQQTGIDRINKVLEFNAAASADTEKIAGIQFDVEPYLLKSSRGYQPPYWDTDKSTVWALYVAYMDSCQKIIDRADSTLYFGIAIPRWYENHVGNSELSRLQSVVDYVAIMDYNEKSSVIIRDAENEINNATILNKRVWIGVETKDVYPEPETVTFHEEGVLFMEEALAEVLNAYGDNPVLSGIAIHAYAYYKSLPLTTSVNYHENVIPQNILYQNSENPVHTNTKISFQIQAPIHTEISIFNIRGQKITTLVHGVQSSGLHEIIWNSSDCSPGVYFYQMKTSDLVQTKKMLLIR